MKNMMPQNPQTSWEEGMTRGPVALLAILPWAALLFILSKAVLVIVSQGNLEPGQACLL